MIHSWMCFPITSTYLLSRFIQTLCFPSKYLCYNFNEWNAFWAMFWLSDYGYCHLYYFCFIFHQGDIFKISERFYWNSGHETIPYTLSPDISSNLRRAFVFYILVLSCVQLFMTPWTVAHPAPLSMDSSRKNTEVGCHFLHQGIFPTQGSNPHFLCLLHYRQILYLMSHQGSPLYINIACRAWFLPAQEHQLSQKWLWRHMTQTPAGPSRQLRVSSPCDCVGGWQLQVSAGCPAQKQAHICLRGGEKA